MHNAENNLIIDENGELRFDRPDPVQDTIVDLVTFLTMERQNRQISQVTLAEMAGMPQSTISRIESLRSVPTMPVLIRIAAVLGFTLGFRHIGEE